MSKYCGDFYCLNCLHSFRGKNKLDLHKNNIRKKYFCNVIMSFEGTKVLEFNQYQKSDKAPFIIYADLECIMGQIDGCENNRENLPTKKVSKHIPSGFSMTAISSFKNIENKSMIYI